MKKLIKAFCMSFSMFCAIPTPFAHVWEDSVRSLMLVVFPFVGAVIGGIWALAAFILDKINCPQMFGAAFLALLPYLLTGGIHLDGYMDCCDAIFSRRPLEKKREILKDSHIGAFAVIMLILYGMVYTGAFSEIVDKSLLRIVCGGFFLARCFSGISVVSFPSAKKDGMLYLFASSSQKIIVKWVLYLQSILCIFFMLWQSLCAGIIVVVAAFLAFAYYYYRSQKELGGITGDTAGYGVLICEVCMMIATAVINVVM